MARLMTAVLMLSLGCASAATARKTTAAAPTDAKADWNGRRIRCQQEILTGSHIPGTVCYDESGTELSAEETQRYLESRRQGGPGHTAPSATP